MINMLRKMHYKAQFDADREDLLDAHMKEIRELKMRHERELEDVRKEVREEEERNNRNERLIEESRRRLEFDEDHMETKKIKSLENKINQLQTSNAELSVANDSLNKMVDLNNDVLDVKDLVKSLIEKLPEVNINTITANIEKSNDEHCSHKHMND